MLKIWFFLEVIFILEKTPQWIEDFFKLKHARLARFLSLDAFYLFTSFQ